MARFVLDNTHVPYEVFLKQQGKKEEQDDVGSHPSTWQRKRRSVISTQNSSWGYSQLSREDETGAFLVRQGQDRF